MTAASPTSRRLCTLATAELFLLCSLRLTAQATRDGRRTNPAYRQGFESARLGAVHAERLAAAVNIIYVAGARAFDVRPPRCGDVSPDEELMIRTVRLLQEEDEFSARRMIWQFLPPSAARVVLQHLDGLAIGMVRAGLALPDFRTSRSTCPAEALAARRLAEAGAFPHAPEPGESAWVH
jgi:hypothetical protein